MDIPLFFAEGQGTATCAASAQRAREPACARASPTLPLTGDAPPAARRSCDGQPSTGTVLVVDDEPQVILGDTPCCFPNSWRK